MYEEWCFVKELVLPVAFTAEVPFCPEFLIFLAFAESCSN